MASLAGGPDVAEVIDVLTGLEAQGEDQVAEAAAWLGVHPVRIRVAIGYYSDYRGEIDAQIQRRRAEAEEYTAATRLSRRCSGEQARVGTRPARTHTVRLLLDEMIGAVVAERLRGRGHDVVAVQDTAYAHLRGIDDCVLLARADEERRAVVTGNVPDFFRCHQRRTESEQGHHGLLLGTDDTFPRHRRELFVRQVIAALEHVLRAYPDDDASGWIRWLVAPREKR